MPAHRATSTSAAGSRFWGFQTGPNDGSYAEYARIPEANAVPKPRKLSWEEAASIPLVLLTAWHMLVTRAGAVTRPVNVAALTWGGTIVTCGNTTGYEAVTDLRYLFNKQLNLLGCHQGSKAELLDGLQWVERGQIRPVVGTVLALQEAARAQELIERGDKIGKLVLTP